jgi:hypothetical protein
MFIHLSDKKLQTKFLKNRSKTTPQINPRRNLDALERPETPIRHLVLKIKVAT